MRLVQWSRWVVFFCWRWLCGMFSLKNRWRAVEVAGWTALALGIASVRLFTAATARSGHAPSLLYPYLASASVFAVTCVWILLAARVGVPSTQIRPVDFRRARIWAFSVFAGLTGLLSLGGLAGQEGENAIRAINGYLFGMPPSGTRSAELGLPFGFFSAAGNALALATLVYIGTLCNALVLSATRRMPHRADPIGSAAVLVRELGQRLQRYLVMASALAVTSTLTLYLCFGAAEQVQQTATATASVPVQTSEAPRWRLDCNALAAELRNLSCHLTQPQILEMKRRPSAAYMALVCGLSFTGVLFVLFYACGSALDDRLMRLTRAAHRATGPAFNVKDFKEQHGLGNTGPGGGILQAVALAAPAFTGLLTVLTS